MPRLRIPITKKVRDEILAFIPQLRAQGLEVATIEFTESGFRIQTGAAGATRACEVDEVDAAIERHWLKHYRDDSR